VDLYRARRPDARDDLGSRAPENLGTFDWNREGSLCGTVDVWMSSRATVRDRWSPPVRLSDVVNSTALDARPAVSLDGTELYFRSTRRGVLAETDLHVSTRTRVKKGGDLLTRR
jgi:hypothetical protein